MDGKRKLIVLAQQQFTYIIKLLIFQLHIRLTITATEQ